MTWSGILRQFVYQYFLSFKGLQNGHLMRRKRNLWGRWCGCSIHPPCGRGNILCFKRLVESTELLIPVVMSALVVKKKKDRKSGSSCELDGQKHWESWAHSDFSTCSRGHLSLATHPLCPLRDPARTMSKNYVVYLVLMNIILQNKHISYRQRVVYCYDVIVRHCEVSFF